jgi:prepilin-type N-terminal cleavage/methylation domain-containing protein
MHSNKKAFTLIELLVVVLIIGILAAIALPQYQIAVLKSHFVSQMPVARSILDSMDRYKLANGVFPTRFSELDITIPNATSTCTTDLASNVDCVIGNNNLEYWLFGPSVEGEGGMMQIRDQKHKMTLEWYSRSRSNYHVTNCIAYTPIAVKTCVSLGGKYLQEYYYTLP